MKKLATLLTLMAGVGLTFGQTVIHNPGLVSFQNTETQKQGVSGHLITNFNGSTRTLLVGTQYAAELYYMDTTSNSLQPIPATLSQFRLSTTSSPGTWNGPTPNIPLPVGYGGVDYFEDGSGEVGGGDLTQPGYYPVILAVRIWDTTLGATWEATPIANRTSTANFTYTQRFSVPNATSDTQMITQGPATITTVPEPSAIALSIIGVAGLLLIRRRK